MSHLLVFALCVRLSAQLALSHLDLELANRTCDEKASCEDIDDYGEIDWRERNCMCDPMCARYGDCCLDSKYFDVAEQRRALASFSCIELRQFGGIYMRTTCPPGWEDRRIRDLCEAGSYGNNHDPLLNLPATSTLSEVTYRNAFCAYCHQETLIDPWSPRLECPTFVHFHNITRDKVTQYLTYNETKSTWGLSINNKFYPCTVDPVIPETSSKIVRRCQVNTVKTCAVNWTNVDVRNRCEAYTSLVYQGKEGYRNPHCAVCNNVPLQYLQCTKTLMREFFNKEFRAAAFAVLFDLTGGRIVGKIRPCNKQQIYDPFFKTCRDILHDISHESDRYYIVVPERHENITDRNAKKNSDLLQNDSINSIEFLQVDAESECLKIVLNKEDYVKENGTIFVPMYGRRYWNGEYRLRHDGSVEVCVDDDFGTKLVDKFGPYMGYITFAGLGISIIFLLLHLTAFALLPELRNLSGKNLACLCLSLLVAYSTFMAGQVLEGTPCYINAVVMYYCFLASFSWMLTMAFDIWRTLRLATAELRVSSGKQWRKFTLYSLWSWVAPGIILGSAIFIDTSPRNAVPADIKPDFGLHSCWFGQRKALLIFFACPIAFTMVLNTIFFGSSAHMIYSSTSTTRFTASAGTQRDFRLYIRLALVMGITWTIGLVAGTFDIEGLWYAFIALNTLQGLFIFLAFTCTDKVIRGLAGRRSDGRPLRPPSFSWSGASTDSTRKSHIGSEHGHSDALY
ncbi:uncharacterized protein LOC142324040 [Lycorma delicatula]|uniref:uncharacterized protein LOC142324040 n=1 Tax=Lycorma delicatula TaxID=130591 RepID=UPI003F516738